MIFNIRTPQSDPRIVLHELQLEPVDWKAELPSEYRRLQPTGRRLGKIPAGNYGPFTRKLIELVAEIEGHRNLGITVRKALLIAGQKPAKLKSWHTDFSRNYSREQCVGIRNYLFLNAGPTTRFLQATDVELESARAVDPEWPTFNIKPWTLVCYNATEVHTSTTAETSGGLRFFFRATVDTVRR